MPGVVARWSASPRYLAVFSRSVSSYAPTLGNHLGRWKRDADGRRPAEGARARRWPTHDSLCDRRRESGSGSRVLLVVGYRSELVRQELTAEKSIEFVEQTEQVGTGHAVMMCRERLSGQSGPWSS